LSILLSGHLSNNNGSTELVYKLNFIDSNFYINDMLQKIKLYKEIIK